MNRLTCEKHNISVDTVNKTCKGPYLIIIPRFGVVLSWCEKKQKWKIKTVFSKSFVTLFLYQIGELEGYEQQRRPFWANLTNAFKFQDKWKLSQLQMIFQWRTYNHKYSDSQMDFFGKWVPFRWQIPLVHFELNFMFNPHNVGLRCILCCMTMSIYDCRDAIAVKNISHEISTSAAQL